MDDKVKNAVDHLKTHVNYPATTEDVMAACESWSDVDEGLKKQAEEKLASMPGKTWNNANDVLMALGWPTM